MQTDEFSEVQKKYNHQIYFPQQQISNKPGHEQMSRKLYYYKHYPHLNDQEVDTYLSIEDKMKSQQQGLDRQKNKEMEL